MPTGNRVRQLRNQQRRRNRENVKAGNVPKPTPGGPTTSDKQQSRRNTAANRKAREGRAKATEPCSVEKVLVHSNKKKGETVNLTGGLVRLMYYESLLANSIRATYTYTDSGNATNNQKTGTSCNNTATAVDGLPIVGEEKMDLIFTDNRGNKLKLEMYVNKVTPFDDETTKSVAQLDLVSKEFIINEKGQSRVKVCMEGKISEHIEKILKQYLKTTKKLDIEETGAKNYNFIGNNKKPFWTMNNLSTKAAPKKNKPGNTAGFLLYETADGYHFKSLDTLLGQKKKKSIIYNQTAEGVTTRIPAGYDLKALEYSRNSAVNVQGKHMMGAYSTRCISFNPFNCEYSESILSADTSKASTASDSKGNQKELTLAGKNFWQSNVEFDSDELNNSFTRTTWNIKDTGTLMGGETKQQIDKSKEENFELENIFNQSIQRYQQLFGQVSTVTVGGDFSLHAGDAVFIDAPKLEANTKASNWNPESGGVYVIADIAHYIAPNGTYTKMNLIRDSVGRKGTHTSRGSGTEDFHGIKVPRSSGSNFL